MHLAPALQRCSAEPGPGLLVVGLPLDTRHVGLLGAAASGAEHRAWILGVRPGGSRSPRVQHPSSSSSRSRLGKEPGCEWLPPPACCLLL